MKIKPLDMDRNQKKGIALQIDDTINTMQLRLQLNQQAINTQLNRSTYIDDGMDFIHAITDKKHQANLVIEECKLTIDKLLLLKKSLAHLTCIKAARLLKTYENYSLENFQHQLTVQIESRTRKSQ